VDVTLKDATLAQAAEALSRASGIAIRVDAGAGAGQQLTVEAKQIPLSRVLESVALNTNAKIVPEANGILLTTWPSLMVTTRAASRDRRSCTQGRSRPGATNGVSVPPTAI
jgi:hypothetical protein